MNKLLKDAIADAKAVRETALANAKREEPAIPAQSLAPSEAKASWKERLGKAFSKENITVKF